MQMTNPQKPTSSSLSEPHNASRRIELMFSKFAAFYGHIWRSQFKDEGFFSFAKKEWQVALDEFSDEILTKAILNCREFYELPPTLPQMVMCCRQIKKQNSFFVEEKDYVPVSKEVVAFYVNKCKEMLAK